MRPNPALVKFLESVLYGKRRDPVAVCARFVLAVFSIVYRALVRFHLLPYQTGLRRRRRLETPVISVGNLTVGGTGKSPTVQYLCKGLTRRGWNPAVLSYGYGGSLHGRFGIVADTSGVRLTPETAGDEPVMLPDELHRLHDRRLRLCRYLRRSAPCLPYTAEDRSQYYRSHFETLSPHDYHL